MLQVPEITPSRRDMVVDEVRYFAPLFGVFGTPRWRVRWRRADSAATCGEIWLGRGDRYGSADLNGEPFTFLVSWREDRRRRPASRNANSVVTPGAVIQLTELSASR